MRSGPLCARVYHRILAAIFAVAWMSLGAQVDVLMGSRGLLPATAFVEAIQSAPFHVAPSIFRLGASDAALTAGVVVGLVLSGAALFGFAPRLCFGIMTPLYLSYAVVARTFMSFQWDNLLIECGALAVLMRSDGPAERLVPPRRFPRWSHFLFLVLLWKLYAESGIAKWQSPLHDWHDGSAMTFYYETAPIPTRLAWFAHALPAWWHRLESWFTLSFELVVPFAAFGPRLGRRIAFVVLTLFQVVNVATANYGFFVYLALALHVFLLEDRDLVRTRVMAKLAWRRLRRLSKLPGPRWRVHFTRETRRRGDKKTSILAPFLRVPAVSHVPMARFVPAAIVVVYVGLSALEGMARFGASDELVDDLAPLRGLYASFRVVNTYHLFAAITRERIEPEVQTSDGMIWTANDLRYKPGDPSRAPPFVAPHQPRVDFQLWFFGLGYQRGMPTYVTALLDRVCRDRDAVAPLFAAPLPERPRAVRVAFWRYHFSTPDERRSSNAWWTREWIGASRALACE